ncbi:MAG: hypothetical protein IPK82_10125 [Polyangiaceae bacterium]|nr:hypothetical protein [Polyangiaceae bacterium]
MRPGDVDYGEVLPSCYNAFVYTKNPPWISAKLIASVVSLGYGVGVRRVVYAMPAR